MPFMMAPQTISKGQSLVRTPGCTMEFAHMVCGDVFR